MGPGAHIGWAGSNYIHDDDFSLTVAGGPPGRLGIFIYAFGTTDVVFGDGFRCIDWVFFRPLPPQTFSAQGTVSTLMDLDGGYYGVNPDTTPKFQFYYRDPGGPGGTGFNLSDAMGLKICD